MKKKFIIILVSLFIIDFILLGMLHSYKMHAKRKPELAQIAEKFEIALKVVNFPTWVICDVIWEKSNDSLGFLEPIFLLFAVFIQAWIYYALYILLKNRVFKRTLEPKKNIST